MSELTQKIMESILAGKPVDTASFFAEELKERIANRLPEVMHQLGESVAHGPEDEDDFEEEGDDEVSFDEIDFDEMSDEDFEDILNALSDEEFDDLIDQIDDLDEEELHELSKKTLASYVTKASKHVGNLAYRQGAASGTFKPGDGSTAQVRFSKDSTKEFQRQTGIQRAARKLAKEEVEQVDEVSADRLATYQHRARVSQVAKSNEGDLKKANDRGRNIHLAQKKLMTPHTTRNQARVGPTDYENKQKARTAAIKKAADEADKK